MHWLLACSLPSGGPAPEALGAWETTLDEPLPPPVAGVTLVVDPVLPGVTSALTASGLGPGDVAYFFMSGTGPGGGPCPGLFGGACLGLLPKVTRLGSDVADAAGLAVVNVAFPAGLSPGATLWFQAAVPIVGNPAALSQTVELTVEDGCENLDTWDLNPTWLRSELASRVTVGAVGACMGVALARPMLNPVVWDDGDFTPVGWFEDGIANGRSWASWDQVGVDCHHFQVAIEVPSCPFTSVVFKSPWFEGIPINDNLYVYVGSKELYRAGTSYGFDYGGPMEVDTYLIPQVEILEADLVPGTNLIDFVVEEYASWGGLGFVEPEVVF